MGGKEKVFFSRMHKFRDHGLSNFYGFRSDLETVLSFDIKVFRILSETVECSKSLVLPNCEKLARIQIYGQFYLILSWNIQNPSNFVALNTKIITLHPSKIVRKRRNSTFFLRTHQTTSTNLCPLYPSHFSPTTNKCSAHILQFDSKNKIYERFKFIHLGLQGK